MRSSRQFCINLFGNFQLTFEDQSAVGLQTERYQSMVAYLILKAPTPQSRSRMATLFWPDVSEAQAKASLRRELFRLRQALPEADRLLHVTSTTLHWQPQVPAWVDVTEFERALQTAQQTEEPQTQITAFKQAIALYQGDLLPACYDDWIVPERERLQQLMLQALGGLCQLAVQVGDARSAVEYSQQLIQQEPLSEVGYLTLMKAHAQQGDRPAALQIYHQCMTLLREEMGIDPSAETRQFYEQLLVDEVPSPLPRSSQLLLSDELAPSSEPAVELEATVLTTNQIDWGGAPDIRLFYGRSEESAQLHQWIQQDHCRLVAVLGLGGIGKTALAAKVSYDLQTDFDFIIWRSLRNAPPLETLLEDLIPFLSAQQEMSDSMTRFVHWLRQSRCLVILDNVETIFKGGEKAGQYRDGYEKYGELFLVTGQANHQSCLLLTSREKLAEVATFAEANPAVRSLQLDGSPEVALALINNKQLTGTQAEKEKLCERCDHSPLSLQIVSSSIQDIFAGDISLFLEEDVVLFNGAKRLLDHQFERLSALEKTVMTWLAINRDWTSLAELKTDIYPVCAIAHLMEALESLCWRSLIQRQGNTYTQQPVIMEYVTDGLIEQVSDELANDCFAAQSCNSLAVVTYPLLKTTVKDFIRESQERLVLQPIAERLEQLLTTPEHAIRNHLKTLQSHKNQAAGYGAGNVINLAWALNMDFTGLDLSKLTIYQAYLQHITLRRVNFNGATFKHTIFNQPFDPVCSMAYSPDSSLLATGDGGGRIVVWHMADQKPILTFKGSTSWLMAIAFTYNGQQLVSEDSNSLHIWDVASGQFIKTLNGHTSLIWALESSPNENLLVSGSVDGDLVVWDLAKYESLHRLTGHTQQINVAMFSPDGQQIVSASVDKTLRMWSTQTGEILKTWPCEVEPQCVSFSPDGKHLAIGKDDGTISILNLQTELIELTLQAHQSQVISLAFSPCGHYLASGSLDATTKLWNPKIGQLLRITTVYTSSIWELKFSPDGKYLAVSSNDPTIRLWEMPQKQLIKTFQGFCSWVNTIQFHPHQPLLLSGSGDHKVRLWHAVRGELVKTFEGQRDWVLRVAISPCGQKTASSSNDCTIHIWNVETGRPLQTLLGHEAPVWSVEFSPDGQQLLSSGFDQTIRLWDAENGQDIKTIQAHKGWIFATRFSPDGRQFASTGMDGSVKLWNVETAEAIRTWESQQGSTWTLAYSAEGKHIFTGGEDANIKLWHAKTGELLQTFEGHAAGIWAVEVSPDGNMLASGSDDQTIKLWDVNTGQCLQTLDLHQSRINTLAFTPDSQILASGSSDETIRLWDLSSGDCLMTLRAPRPYEGMNITDAQGLTEAQIESLKSLGAIADSATSVPSKIGSSGMSMLL